MNRYQTAWRSVDCVYQGNEDAVGGVKRRLRLSPQILTILGTSYIYAPSASDTSRQETILFAT